jgi:hypothetical protein
VPSKKQRSFIALAAILASALPLSAQPPQPQARVLGTVTLYSGIPVLALRADISRAPREASVRRALSRTTEVDSGTPRRVWPYFALGGAIVGGVGVALFANAKCDAGCQDDGAVGLPAYVATGAVIGAVVGAIVGLAVEHGPRPYHRLHILPRW